MVGAYASALAYVAVLQWTLPRSDVAYGRAFSETLRDPFVRDTAAWFANVSGLVVFVIAFFVLRRRNLLASFAITLGCVLTEIVIFTPLDRRVGLVGAPVVLACALVLCRRSSAKVLRVGPD
jgi:hypothetical protein